MNRRAARLAIFGIGIVNLGLVLWLLPHPSGARPSILAPLSIVGPTVVALVLPDRHGLATAVRLTIVALGLAAALLWASS